MQVISWQRRGGCCCAKYGDSMSPSQVRNAPLAAVRITGFWFGRLAAGDRPERPKNAVLHHTSCSVLARVGGVLGIISAHGDGTPRPGKAPGPIPRPRVEKRSRHSHHGLPKRMEGHM